MTNSFILFGGKLLDLVVRNTCAGVMEISDDLLMRNIDLDPSYLSSIFDIEFSDCSELWVNEMDDSQLLQVVEQTEKYCPVVEDISLDDNVLYSAVEQIETE